MYENMKLSEAISLKQELGTEIVLKWLHRKKLLLLRCHLLTVEKIAENKSKFEDKMIMSRSAVFQYATVNKWILSLLLFLL